MTRAPEYDNYKGYDLIRIFTGRKFKRKGSGGEEMEESISFGVRKAQAICDNFDAIRIFAENGDKGEGGITHAVPAERD